MAKKTRSQARARRHRRIRLRVSGTASKPRLNVYRSLTEIYAQIIDDVAGHTLVAASTLDQEIRGELEGLNKTDQAKVVGEALGKRALDEGIRSVVFDRGGYKYIGRVKALADGARKAGLEF